MSKQTTPTRSILYYFFPEFIVALVLYTMVGLIDAQCVAHLKSTSCYATLGVTNTLILFINKLAEGISVGAVIMCGMYHGQKNNSMVGKAATAALWATTLVGCSIASFLYLNAENIYRWLRIPESMFADGVPFLQIRALGIAFLFLFSALIGFLRGVKNTRAGMYFFVLGAVVFIFFDYALIFGMFGFPELGFQGSAVAFALQYITMFCAALIYILLKPEYSVYGINLTKSSWPLVKAMFRLSWPVTADKAALQIEKLWMVRLIAPMGSAVLGGMNVIKDMEALAFVPAIAFGQVVTLLASNEMGAGNFTTVKNNTRLIMGMAIGMVAVLVGIFMLNAQSIISIFDRQNSFTQFALTAFPIAGLLLFFDLVQVILAGALRGTGNVRVVMWVRIITAGAFFIPLSYGASLIPCENGVMKFMLIYGSFNLVNGLASIAYLYWFRSGRWLPRW
jgi:putative MATE family efflux protein